MFLKKTGSKVRVRRLLIYRTGSLGDTVVALGSFRRIAEAFPDADRKVLTAIPTNKEMISPEVILGGTGYVHGFLHYDARATAFKKLRSLRRKISAYKPDLMVYLAEPVSAAVVWRNALTFRLCGVRHLIGVPYRKRSRAHEWIPARGCYEHESERLLRTIDKLPAARSDPCDPAELDLSSAEISGTKLRLSGWEGYDCFFVVSMGSRVQVKDWGRTNWIALFEELAGDLGSRGLLFVGGKEDHELSSRVSAVWPGPTLNLCGSLTPRESAAVMAHSELFIGHDGGAMHLAAAVSVRCVAIFSARSLPGVWFPLGEGHRVFYQSMVCRGCHLDVCKEHNKVCISSISADQVALAVRSLVLDSR